MSEAPETIWAFYAPDIADDNCGATIIAHETIQHGSKCYRRADLPPTLSAAMELPEVRDVLIVLASFISETVEYMTVNKLGDPEQQHNVKWGRAALAPFKGLRT